MLHIVMDSAGDIPPEWIDEYNLHIIPINIHFGGKTYLQGVDLSEDDFYQIADESGIVPKTSQPTPQQFEALYERIANPGDTILSIHVTAKLSGTFASAEMAAKDLKARFKVIPFDSASGSAAMGFMVKEARILERAGASIEDILRRLELIRRRVSIVLTLDTLEYAKRSGRVKAIQAALASLLNVKPIIVLHEGVLEMADRVRTRHKALEQVVEMIRHRVGNKLVNAASVHAQDPQAGNFLLERLRECLNCKELIMTSLSVGVAANLGPGTVGVVAYVVEER